MTGRENGRCGQKGDDHVKNTIYMLPMTNGNIGNSFIITTEDDRVIVIDGGWRSDTDHLIDRLIEITGEKVPHVHGWLLSHPHSDHIDAFMGVYERRQDAVIIDKVYYNFPSVQFCMRGEPHDGHTVREFYALLPKFAGVAQIVSQGDTFSVGAAGFEVMYSPDPAIFANTINNATTVFRMTLGGKSVIWLGDLGAEAGNKMLLCHGDRLKSDIVQMAHHGQNGVDRPVYEAIAAKTCLWPTPQWLWDNDAGKGYNTHQWKTIVVQGWMKELGADEWYAYKDGEQTIEL